MTVIGRVTDKATELNPAELDRELDEPGLGDPNGMIGTDRRERVVRVELPTDLIEA